MVITKWLLIPCNDCWLFFSWGGGSEEEELIFLTQPPFVAHLFNFFFVLFYTTTTATTIYYPVPPTPPFFCTSGRQLPTYCTGFHCFDELVLICNTYTPTLVPLSYYQHAVSVGSQCMDIIFFFSWSLNIKPPPVSVLLS